MEPREEVSNVINLTRQSGDTWTITSTQIVRRRETPAGYDWPERLRARCIELGYGDVLIGQCDVEGVDANGESFCREPHREGPEMFGNPAIREILDEIGVPHTSASCHWVGLDRQRMSPEQRAAVEGRRYWVCERWRDKHHSGCPRLSNPYQACTCPQST